MLPTANRRQTPVTPFQLSPARFEKVSVFLSSRRLHFIIVVIGKMELDEGCPNTCYEYRYCIATCSGMYSGNMKWLRA